MEKRTETVIDASFAKQIKLIETDKQRYIEKQFFQHQNIEVYHILKNNPHPNICHILDVRQSFDHFTIEEAYLGTQTLSDVIPMSNMNLFYIYIIQLCDALTHLHQFNIVHRDLKPENIFIHQGRIVLNDFDISKEIIARPQRKDTQVLGSVGFASPEQYGFSRSDARSDIYSLGVIINLMITGQFISDVYIKGRLKYIVDRCVQINPRDRYQTIEAVKHELSMQSQGKSRYTLPGFRKGRRRNKIIATIGYLFLIYIIMIIKTTNGTTLLDHIESKIIATLLSAATIISVCDYLDIRQLLPYGLRKHRIIATATLWLINTIIMTLLGGIIIGIIRSML